MIDFIIAKYFSLIRMANYDPFASTDLLWYWLLNFVFLNTDRISMIPKQWQPLTIEPKVGVGYIVDGI